MVAQEYRRARVFCAGDAVHRHPPMNGLGGNTCIQDAFNLAWKIAAVLRWGAGDGLLESYEQERQPIGRAVVDRSIESWRQNPQVVQALGIDPTASPARRQAQFEVLFEDSEDGEARRAAFQKAKRARAYAFHAHGAEMNHHYSSPAVVSDGSDRPGAEFDSQLHFQMSSSPGSRLPHAWLGYGGRTVSSLDLCGPEQFTLLTRARGAPWVSAARQLAEEFGLPLPALRIGPGCEVADLYGTWGEIAGIGESGALLVRPDQHVAWRMHTLPEDPSQALADALRQVLDLT